MKSIGSSVGGFFRNEQKSEGKIILFRNYNERQQVKYVPFPPGYFIQFVGNNVSNGLVFWQKICQEN